MRKFFLAFALFAGTVSMLNAQDVITLKNGSEIQAKVLEIGTTDITYKMYSNQSGPNYTKPKSDVFRIVDSGGNILYINQGETDDKSKKLEYDGNYKPSSDEPERKGYVSLALGMAVMTEDYNDAGAGVQLTLNAAYLFAKNVGIDATFLYTSYSIDDEDYTIGATGFFAGPLFSFATGGQKIEIDFKPQIGTSTIKTSGSLSTSFKTKFSYGGGVSVRFNITSRIAISVNTDYYSIVAKELESLNLSHIGVTGGFHFRF
jgi:hypothetical protein